MKKHNFKVGDIVIGKPSASYYYSTTCENYTGKVTDIINESTITVDCYNVEARHFRLKFNPFLRD